MELQNDKSQEMALARCDKKQATGETENKRDNDAVLPST